MLKKFLKQFSDKPSALLVFTEEPYLIKGYKQIVNTVLLENKNIDFNFDYFDDDTFDIKAVAEAFYKSPFMSKKRVVLINKAEKIDYAKLQKLQPLLDKVKKTFLIFIFNEIPKKEKLNKKFFKKFSKEQILTLKTPTKADLKRFTDNFLRKENKNITVEALELLLESIDNNYLQLENELMKLLNGTPKNENIEFEDVLKITYAQNTYSVFDLLNLILEDKLSLTLEILKKYFENSPNSELIKFYALLHSQFQKLLLYYYYKQKGYNFSDAARYSALNYFDQKRVKSQKSNISFKNLLQKYEILLEYEPLIKFGGAVSYYYMEEMILKIIKE